MTGESPISKVNGLTVMAFPPKTDPIVGIPDQTSAIRTASPDLFQRYDSGKSNLSMFYTNQK